MGRVALPFRRAFAGLTVAMLALTACSPAKHPVSAGSSAPAVSASVSPAPANPTASPSPSPPVVPRFDHIVVAVFENHGYAQVIGAGQAPYLNELASRGALLTDAHGLTHPSQPNYIGMFAGSTYGATDD